MQQLTWRPALVTALHLLLIVLSALTVWRTSTVALTAVIGPALLLYGGILGLGGARLALRGDGRAATAAMWESVGWATLGAAVVLIFRRPYPALLLPLALAAALLQEQRPHWRQRINEATLPAVGLLVSFVLLAPLWWMLVASLRSPALPQPNRLSWWPTAPTVANYLQLPSLPGFPLWRFVGNSVMITALGTPLALLVAAAAGFAISQLAPRWQRMILAASVVGLAVPSMALWLTRFFIFRWLGLLDTPLVLLAPVLLGGSPLCVLVLYRAFRSLPREQWDQAHLDGASFGRMWWSVGLPQVRSTLVALSTLVFGLFWGNFIDPVLYLTGPRWQTLPVGLRFLQQLDRGDWPLLLAGAVVATLPALLVFALAQRALLGAVLLPHDRQR